jgi:hypothetical protein
MGFAVGGQMTGAMGGLFAGQVQPGVGAVSSTPPPLPSQVQFYIALNGQQTGPFDMVVLQQMVQSGQMTRDSLVWKQGMASWDAAGQITEISALFGAVPPPLPTV